MAHSAEDLDLAAIAIFTESGTTARLLSKYRPDAPIFALSPFPEVVNRAVLLWGTQPILCDRFTNTDMLVDMAEEILEKGGHVHQRQVLGIVAARRHCRARPTSCGYIWSAINSFGPLRVALALLANKSQWRLKY